MRRRAGPLGAPSSPQRVWGRVRVRTEIGIHVHPPERVQGVAAEVAVVRSKGAPSVTMPFDMGALHDCSCQHICSVTSPQVAGLTIAHGNEMELRTLLFSIAAVLLAGVTADPDDPPAQLAGYASLRDARSAAQALAGWVG